MDKTTCCNLGYIGENHNPVHTATYCRNCGHIHSFNQKDEQIKILREALEDIKILKEALEHVKIFNDVHAGGSNQSLCSYNIAKEALKKVDSMGGGE